MVILSDFFPNIFIIYQLHFHANKVILCHEENKKVLRGLSRGRDVIEYILALFTHVER